MPSTEHRLPDWVRAHGAPLFQGLIKQSESDFDVTEIPGFDLSGDGEHDYLWIQKTGANTAWVARALAAHAGVPARDVGYAGLKDRHAVTRQWFSIRRPTGEGTDWAAFELPGAEILEIGRHQRKLKRGAHAGNRFRIVIRGADAAREAIAGRLERIGRQGVPNYFGSQRFGRHGNNLQLAHAVFAGKRMKRDKRSIALSAARSFLFNEILADRVGTGTWNTALPGEAVNLDGSNSVFIPDVIDRDLTARLQSLDIHPTGALWGRGELRCTGEAAEADLRAADRHADLKNGLERAGLEMSRRALRLVVRDLEWALDSDTLEVQFVLNRGGFATTVIREFMSVADA